MTTHRGPDHARALSRRGLLGGAAATAAALGMASRASAAPSAARTAALTRAGFQASDNVILIGTLGEAATINPFLQSDTEAYWRCKLMFEQFVRVDGQVCHLVLIAKGADGKTIEERTEVPRGHGDAD